MATKENTFSKWGCQEKLNITENLLMNVIINGDSVETHCLPTEPPTYGIVLELYYFANEIACSLHRKPNRILKCLMDALYPEFSISRADRLEKKVKILCSCLENNSSIDLNKKWIPQPTGI